MRNEKGRFVKGIVPWNKRGKYVRCEECGNQIWRTTHHFVRNNYHFCSHSCSSVWKRGKAGRPKIGVISKCKECGKDIYTTPSRKVDGRGVFCSTKCHDDWRRGKTGSRPKTGKIIKCSVCGKEIYRQKCHLKKCNKHVCSKVCMSELIKKRWRNPEYSAMMRKVLDENHKKQKGRVHSEETKKKLSEITKRRWRENIEWATMVRGILDKNHKERIGKTPWNYRGVFYRWRGIVWADWRKLRIRVLERDGYICKECGLFSIDGSELHVHHINPYKLSKDNSMGNLISLCVSCHSTTENAFWKSFPQKQTFLHSFESKIK